MTLGTKLAGIGLVLALLADLFFILYPAQGTACKGTASVRITDGIQETKQNDLVCEKTTGETFIEREGSRGAVILAIPTALAGLIFLSTLSPSPTVHQIAVVPLVLLLFGILLAIASIGLFFLPAAIACTLAHVYRRPAEVGRAA